jgi:hypothetical protein
VLGLAPTDNWPHGEGLMPSLKPANLSPVTSTVEREIMKLRIQENSKKKKTGARAWHLVQAPNIL